MILDFKILSLWFVIEDLWYNTLTRKNNWFLNVLVKSNFATPTPFGSVSCFVVGICLSNYNLNSFLIHQASYSKEYQWYLIHRENLGSIWKIGRYPIKVSEVLKPSKRLPYMSTYNQGWESSGLIRISWLSTGIWCVKCQCKFGWNLVLKLLNWFYHRLSIKWVLSIGIMLIKAFNRWSKNLFGSIQDLTDRFSGLRMSDCSHPCTT